MCIVNKYSIKDPKFYKIKYILHKYATDYGNKFQLFKRICAWKLEFVGAVFIIKSDGINNWRVTNYLIKKEYYRKRGYRFSHISEMNIPFVTNLGHLTYKHYLEQPMSMVERLLKEEISQNPELRKKLTNLPLPLIWKYKDYFDDDNNENVEY